LIKLFQGFNYLDSNFYKAICSNNCINNFVFRRIKLIHTEVVVVVVVEVACHVKVCFIFQFVL